MKKKKEKAKDFKVRTESRLAKTLTGAGNDLDVMFYKLCSANTLLQKPKLKVGKARPKADNFTDTSFKAKCELLL